MAPSQIGLDDPIIDPPPGVVANLQNPYSLQKYDILCQTVCLTIATILISIRLYTKWRVLHSLGRDDWTSIVSFLGLITYGAIFFAADHYGDGRHLWNITVRNFINYAFLINASSVVYSVTILFAKLSILLLYLRVFSPARRVRFAILAVLLANVAFYIIGIFVEIFRCNPRRKIWLTWIEGKCISQIAANIAGAVWNTVSDFVILILPLNTVRALKIKKSAKIGTIAIFATGLLGCVTSLVRMILFLQRRQRVWDATWQWYSLNLWSYAEITCAIICGCLPAMPAFVRHIREKAKTSSTASSAAIVRSVTAKTPGTKMMQSNRDAAYTNELSADDMIALQDTRCSLTETNIESKASSETRDLERAMV
ncbi:MAG: hypothetical protein Q9195_005006 [Heterodermia aff. obscurata]